MILKVFFSLNDFMILYDTLRHEVKITGNSSWEQAEHDYFQLCKHETEAKKVVRILQICNMANKLDLLGFSY